jgi:hypothetical protein
MDSSTPARSAASSRKWTLFWRLVGAAFFVLFLVRALHSNRDDFLAYYAAGARAIHGNSPYAAEETPFRYLPMTAYFFAPFTLFPVKVARVIFFALNYGACVALYAGFRKRLGDLAALLLLALFARFHNHDFGNAQVNPILLVLFFYWWLARARNLAASSLAFSLFGSFKLLPFAIGFPLLVRARWREIAWIAIWTTVLNFLPVFFYGNGPLVFADWFAHTKGVTDPTMLPNVQSIQSALWWILEGRMTPETFRVLERVFQSALLVAAVALAPKRNREAWMIAGALAVTVLCSPLAWKHNYLQFLPLAGLWLLEDPRFAETRTRILYGIAFAGLVALPSLFGLGDRVFADHLYFMPWTGVILILLGPILARRAEAQILPIEK